VRLVGPSRDAKYWRAVYPITKRLLVMVPDRICVSLPSITWRKCAGAFLGFCCVNPGPPPSHALPELYIGYRLYIQSSYRINCPPPTHLRVLLRNLDLPRHSKLSRFPGFDNQGNAELPTDAVFLTCVLFCRFWRLRTLVPGVYPPPPFKRLSTLHGGC